MLNDELIEHDLASKGSKDSLEPAEACLLVGMGVGGGLGGAKIAPLLAINPIAGASVGAMVGLGVATYAILDHRAEVQALEEARQESIKQNELIADLQKNLVLMELENLNMAASNHAILENADRLQEQFQELDFQNFQNVLKVLKQRV